MEHTSKKLKNSEIEMMITVTPAEYEKHLRKAAERISNRTTIKGFRKGHAPFDMVKREIGEMHVMNEALEDILQETFYKAVTEEKLDTIGMPKINIEKIAPGNDLVYKAVVALLPVVTLPKLDKIKVEHKAKPVTEIDIDAVIENLTKMQATEVVKEGKATKEDKVVIDMDLLLDGVPIEGGQAKDYQVYLSENQHIPGFNDALVGVAKGEEKEFDIPFPKDYYNKMLAGNTGHFKTKVKEVYTRVFPEVNDEFAKKLGQESVAKLRELLQHNLEHEALHKADEVAEIEMFDALIDKSKFEEIPEVLIDAERKKMFYELKRDLEKNGITVDQYLADLKKTEEDIQKDFTEQATKRAKAALVSRQIARDESIVVSDEELRAEIEKMKKEYKDHPEYLENLTKVEVQDSVRVYLVNRKVINFLREKVLTGRPEHKHE